MIGGTKDSDPGYRAVRCPFRRLIVLLPQGGEELVAATTFIRSGPRLSSQVISGGRDKAPHHHLKRETLSRRRPADGADILGGVVGPADPLPGGRRQNQFRRGHRSPPVIGEVFYEPSTAAHSKERKRSPKEFILTGFPHHDNPQAETKDSYTQSHHPVRRPFRQRPNLLNYFFPIGSQLHEP